jgi:hypothetical protein
MPIIRFALLAAAAALAGCAGPTTTGIAMSDHGTLVPSGRITIDFTRGADGPSRPHTGHALEIGGTRVTGEDRQELAAGSLPVVFGGRSFAAPNELRHEFDFRFAELAYRYRHFFGTGEFGLEALGGIGYAQLELTVTSAAQRANDKLSNGGLLAGVGMVWKLLPSTSLQSRLTLFTGGVEDVNDATRFDIHLAQAIGRHAVLRAGFATWRVHAEDDSSVNSSIRMRFSGPALGLELAF